MAVEFEPGDEAADYECAAYPENTQGAVDWVECVTGDDIELQGATDGRYEVAVSNVDDEDDWDSIVFRVDRKAPDTAITAGTAEGALTNVTQQVFAFGADGNVDSSPARRRFTLDTVAPSVSYTDKDLDARESTTEWTFSSDEAGATYECSVDGGTFVACPSPHTTVLPPGERSFNVRAVDPAGNVGTAKGLTWTVAPLPIQQPTVRPTVTSGRRRSHSRPRARRASRSRSPPTGRRP